MRTQLVDTSKPEVETALRWLQTLIFPADEVLDPTVGWWWVVRDGEVPVAFAGLRSVPSWKGAVYLARCGVLRAYRGRGIQKALIDIRQRKAKALGFTDLITTTYRNPTSANNLIRRGFFVYEPHRRWGAEDTIYWKKKIA